MNGIVLLGEGLRDRVGADLESFGYHVHAVDVVAPSAFGQQWNRQDLVRARVRHGRRLPLHFLADRRVQDRLEDATCGRVGEDALAEARAVQASVGAEDPGTESLHHARERRPAGFDHLASNDVGVDQRRAAGDEQVGDGGLAAGDAAGQGDAEGPRADRRIAGNGFDVVAAHGGPILRQPAVTPRQRPAQGPR